VARKSRKNPKAATQAPKQQIGAYVRLSSGEKNADSIENQQAIIAGYINNKPGLELKETYIDSGLSGQSFARPAFNRLLADIKIGKINCIVTKDLSRLGRNAIDTGYYIEKFFPKSGIRFIAITDNYDSADINSSNIMLSLKNMINEAYECVP
jgi:DNA invertase Pin-like site-specific DNA recombinase